ncbi:signal transduction histidine kinase [Microbacterium trichothecenolyticum]|uniref:sensor histidine kinase n=1 Tax=Microbacterium trichothecenolyticum TaxID=69370 RepID=UPI00285D8D13|nr:histidine kinase [Microbacterium trichothecenolyticum]MDR7184798.1 signal transduction histidine kinase [Microbacterium trichothecenolyticum]
MFRRMKTSQLVVDVIVAVGFFLIAWPVETVLATGTLGLEYRLGSLGQIITGLLIAALFSGALALRRLSPPLALGIAWVGALVQMGLGRPPSFSDVAIFGILYTTAAYGTRLVYWAGFASALVGALVITVYLFAGPVFAGGGLSWQTLPLALVVLVAGAFALGLSWTIGALVRTAVRARENREAQQRAEAETAAEQERVRIARDMHDVVAHSLAVVIAQADGARYTLTAAQTGKGDMKTLSDPAVATDALATISATARSALADVRLLLGQLRHRQGDGPQPTIADLEELYAQVRTAGVQLRVDVDPAPPGEPPAAVQLAVYRILQEALTNTLRHGAPGGSVDVRLSWLPDRVELDVRNPVSPGSQPGRSGHGIIGMRERAQLAGGRLDAADEGGAFIVRATIPLGGPA